MGMWLGDEECIQNFRRETSWKRSVVRQRRR